VDKKDSHIKNILHGFFLSIGTTIAEPHTILPIIITYFGGGTILVGVFSSLLRGGAILVQLFAAFFAQSYPLVLKYLRRVFFIRFVAWFSIGFAIITLGDNHPQLTLLFMGIALFFFSFSAGFGAIYFRELTAKIFSHKFRGKTMATRQFFAAVGSILSGSLAGYILQVTTPPHNFAYLFMVSAVMMGFGFIAMGSVEEPVKKNISQKEKSFKEFLKNALKILKADEHLRVQVRTFLLFYSYLFALPFVILKAKQTIELDGVALGTIITAQMIGAMISNFLWGYLSSKGKNKLVTQIAISLLILAISLAFIANHLYLYMTIFFLAGAAMDGNRIASGNLLIQISPEDKRPIYSALQMTIVSFGMFFSIIGGVILKFSSFELLYAFAIFWLILALISSAKLIEYPNKR
jgi:MFS family permease